MMKSYDELLKYVPLVKTLAEQGESEALEVLYKNVSVVFFCPLLSLLRVTCIYSCERARIWLAGMMLVI